MDKYTIFTRPSGGLKVAVAYCSDDQGHIFALNADEIDSVPACGFKTEAIKILGDDDLVCESCYGAVKSWALGGLLKVIGDENE